MLKRVLLILIIGFFIAERADATLFFQSQEESYLPDLPLPSSIYNLGTGFVPPQAQGYTRTVTGNAQGTKVLEWKTDVPNATDMFNTLVYGTTPPNGGTLYLAFFIKAIRVNGVQIWPNGNGSNEGIDKAIELVGPNYRWTLDFGIRAQNTPPVKWTTIIGNPNPGHFNPACEDYDSYNQNFNGYGGGRPVTPCYPNNPNTPFMMDYERWYAYVFKVTFDGGSSGEVGMWINGTKVFQMMNIKTCGVAASSCAHDRLQVWGTYNQPGYNGPIHKRQVDALVVTDDLSYLQANGYFRDPGGAGTSPAPPSNLRVQ